MKFHNQVLSLHSDALPADTLMIARLVGEERISGLFRFELDLICEDTELDLKAVLYAPARLGISAAVSLAGGEVAHATREIAGMFAEFEQLESGQGSAKKYRAVFVPKLWQATRSYRSRVYQNMTIEDLVRAVLEQNGLDPELDFEFRLTRPGSDGDPETRAVYPQREYVVQYEESDWQFLARWLEHEGIFFYFVNDSGDEKVIFADSDSGYEASEFGQVYPYHPEATGEGGDSDEFTEEEIRTFRCRHTPLPKSVTVNDYNWRLPTTRLHYSEQVLDNGTGQQTEYNDHFKNEEQGKALVTLRAEELTCRAEVYRGSGSCRAFCPGTTFTLAEHFRDDWNRSYVLVSVRHEAEQMISLESATITGVSYGNTFATVTDDQAWRPERTTPWPSINGVMHAKVDAEGEGLYAELDEFGRYKLTMPFDEHVDEAEPGKASRWVRMAQPYAGENAGMHFPLAKGTEVMVTHIDGDPDRPIIAGAVPNPETASPTTGANLTRNSIRTRSGNVLQMDDNAAASGFLIMDAARSTVSDSRQRRPLQAGLPTTRGKSFSEKEVVKRLEALENPEETTLSEAWSEFFTGQAFQDTATDGNLNTVTGNAASLTSVPQPGFTDTKISEDNIVKALNYVLQHYTPIDKTAPDINLDANATSPTNATVTGRLADLLETKGQDFLGSAKGTRVKIFVDDTVQFSIGDTYKYIDGSTAISVSTGGYSRKEVLAGSTTDNILHGHHGSTTVRFGNNNSAEISHGSKHSASLAFSGEAGVSLQLSGKARLDLAGALHTVNKIDLAVYNTNSLFIGAKAGLEICVAPKIDIKIGVQTGAINLTKWNWQMGLKQSKFWMKSSDVKMQKEEVDLNKTVARLLGTESVVKDTDNKLSAINNILSGTKNALNENTQALSQSLKSLSQQTMVLAGDDKRVMNNVTAAMTKMTSGVTMI